MPQTLHKQNIKDYSSQRTLTHLSLNCSEFTRFPKAETAGSWEQGPTGESWEVSIFCQLPTDGYLTPTLLTH